jgi:hypothetical protein
MVLKRVARLKVQTKETQAREATTIQAAMRPAATRMVKVRQPVAMMAQ